MPFPFLPFLPFLPARTHQAIPEFKLDAKNGVWDQDRNPVTDATAHRDTHAGGYVSWIKQD